MATLMWRGFCFPFLSAIASMGIGACFFLGGEGLGVLSKCGLILGSRSFKIPWDGLALGPKLSYNNISIDVFLRSVSCRCFHILCFISKWGGLGMNGTWMDTNICSHVVCTSKPTHKSGRWKLSHSVNNYKWRRLSCQVSKSKSRRIFSFFSTHVHG